MNSDFTVTYTYTHPPCVHVLLCVSSVFVCCYTVLLQFRINGQGQFTVQDSHDYSIDGGVCDWISLFYKAGQEGIRGTQRQHLSTEQRQILQRTREKAAIDNSFLILM